VLLSHLHLSLQTTIAITTEPMDHLFAGAARCAPLKVTGERLDGYPELQKKMLKSNDFS